MSSTAKLFLLIPSLFFLCHSSAHADNRITFGKNYFSYQNFNYANPVNHGAKRRDSGNKAFLSYSFSKKKHKDHSNRRRYKNQVMIPRASFDYYNNRRSRFHDRGHQWRYHGDTRRRDSRWIQGTWLSP